MFAYHRKRSRGCEQPVEQPALGNAVREGAWGSPSQEELEQLSRTHPGWTAMVAAVFGLCVIPDGSVQCRQFGASIHAKPGA